MRTLCVCKYTICMQSPQRPEEVVGCPATGVTNNLLVTVWKLGVVPGTSTRAGSDLNH